MKHIYINFSCFSLGLLFAYGIVRFTEEGQDNLNSSEFTYKLKNRNNVKNKKYPEDSIFDKINKYDDLFQLAKADPRSAVTALLRDSKDSMDSSLCSIVFQAWGEQSPAEAVNFLLMPENANLPYEAMSAVLSAMLKDDPNKALAALDDLPYLSNIGFIAESFFKEWASDDVESLLINIDKISKPSLHHLAIESIAKQFGTSNPTKGIEFIDSIKDASIREKALSGLLNGWGASSPKEAVSYIESTGGGDLLSASAIESFLKGWSKIDPDSAFRWAENLSPTGAQGRALTTVIMAINFTSRDMNSTLDLVESLDSGVIKDNIIATISHNWKGDDFGKISSLVFSNDSGLNGSLAQSVISRNWVAKDLAAAEKFLLEQGGYIRNPALGESVIAGIMGQDPNRASQIIRSELNSGNSNFVRSVVADLAKVNSDATGTLVRELKSKNLVHDLDRIYVSGLAEIKPVSAMAWIENNIPEQRQSDSVRVAIDQWIRKDQYAVTQYVSEMPKSKNRNAAISAMVQSIARTDFPSALKWTVQIDESNVRVSSLRSIASYISLDQLDNFQEMIFDSGIDPEDIQYLERK